MIAYVPHLAEGLPYDVDATGTPCEPFARIDGPHPEDDHIRGSGRRLMALQAAGDARRRRAREYQRRYNEERRCKY